MKTHNELKKGDRVAAFGLFGQGPRYAEVMDNKKGITRLLHIEESNGHYPDMGSVYVDEIFGYEDDEGIFRELQMSDSHKKQMDKVRHALDGWI